MQRSGRVQVSRAEPVSGGRVVDRGHLPQAILDRAHGVVGLELSSLQLDRERHRVGGVDVIGLERDAVGAVEVRHERRPQQQIGERVGREAEVLAGVVLESAGVGIGGERREPGARGIAGPRAHAQTGAAGQVGGVDHFGVAPRALGNGGARSPGPVLNEDHDLVSGIEHAVVVVVLDLDRQLDRGVGRRLILQELVAMNAQLGIRNAGRESRGAEIVERQTPDTGGVDLDPDLGLPLVQGERAIGSAPCIPRIEHAGARRQRARGPEGSALIVIEERAAQHRLDEAVGRRGHSGADRAADERDPHRHRSPHRQALRRFVIEKRMQLDRGDALPAQLEGLAHRELALRPRGVGGRRHRRDHGVIAHAGSIAFESIPGPDACTDAVA